MGRYDDYDDERVVIVERESSGSGLGALLLGLAIGAAAALLLAPDSGEATRARIRREAKRAQTRARETFDEMTDELSETYERTLEAVERKAAQARGAVKSKARAVGDAVETRTRAVGDAVDAGKVAAQQAKVELERAVEKTTRAYTEARKHPRAIDAVGSRDAADAAVDEDAGSA